MQRNKDGEPKLFKQFGLFSLLLITAFSSLSANDFEDFKRVQNVAFRKYKDKKDTTFESYLKHQWSEYKAYKSPSLYKEMKPKMITEAKKSKFVIGGPSIYIKVKEKVQEPFVGNKNLKTTKGFIVDYFGTPLSFNLDKSIKRAKFSPKDKEGILNAFSLFATSDYEGLLQEIQNSCDSLGLNDWGLYILVQKIAKQTFQGLDEQKLFSWFLLNKLGYDTKVAIQERHIVLLSLTKQIVYAAPRYTIKGKKYYRLAPTTKAGKVYTYEQDYPNALKALDFSLEKLPYLAKNIQTKTKIFSMQNKKYTLSYRYNENLIDFMGTYPQVSYSVYFNAPLEEETYKDLALGIKSYLDGKKMTYGLNFVLRFVQTAFGYERDNEQFGKEKVMFAEETLFYDKSDCEDRADLYASLVKSLFGISVVGVKYSDHIATALYIPIQGDNVKVDIRRYVIADPTYINANVGQSMPKYRRVIPEKFIYLR
ncbi:hypothetical protein [Sulfurimonas sp.]